MKIRRDERAAGKIVKIEQERGRKRRRRRRRRQTGERLTEGEAAREYGSIIKT